MSKRIQFLSLPAICLLAASANADTIFLTTGKSISDVEIQDEKLDFVSYKDGRDKKEVRSEEVLSIKYTSKPSLLDRAEVAVSDENFEAGAADLEEYIAGVISKPPRRHTWAPAYAMYRLIEVYETVGRLDLMVKAADQLLENAAESRYVPLAYLKKGDALFDSGKPEDAQAVLAAFDKLRSEKNLVGRWGVESELRGVLYDSKLTGSKRQTALKDVSAKAGVAYPTVRNKAEVALGESLLEAKNFTEAEKIFKDVTEDPKADDRTIAAAWCGLGDCLYQRATKMAQGDPKRAAVLNEALMAYLRVVVVYKLELRYAPKAMFWAGRAFDLQGDDESKSRAQEMYSKVIRNFRGSRWADEAKGFRKR